MNLSLWVVLLVAFIDYLGVGLIYPIFSSMLFDAELSFLPQDTSHHVRGIYLGVLLSLQPLFQFFSSPLWGAHSDGRGRKPSLELSLIIALFGYTIACLGMWIMSIPILFLSRAIIGISSGNLSVVQASIADLSSAKEKAKNFGLYSMALGAGFTFGPFFGGILSWWGYTIPFFFATGIVAINLLLAHLCFQETHVTPFSSPITWKMGLVNLKKAFHLHGLRMILLTMFFHVFAWSFFSNLLPSISLPTLHFLPLI